MYILGVSCFYHDAAAALLKDGELVAASEEERFSRKKHDSGFPHGAIAFCLRQAGIQPGDLDYVVFYEKPLLKFDRILRSGLATFPRSWLLFRESLITWMNEKLWIKALLQEQLPDVPADRFLFVEHHLSHAASAFFASPFEEAAIVTIDGVGEWTTTTVGKGVATWDGRGENRIDLLQEVRFPHSLGLLYSAFTAYLGFRVNNGEYKVMGMAPYGEPRYVDRVEKLIRVYDDGSFWLDLDYFEFQHSPLRTFSDRFIKLFGPPRVAESEFYTYTTHPRRDHPAWNEEKARINQHYADIAASIQHVTEEVMLKLARHAYELTGSKNLCMAGGVALNSVGNGRIQREGPFEHVYIQPAAGDSGGALGAALYAYHVLLGRPRRFVMEHAYWGEGFDDTTIHRFLTEQGIPFEAADDEHIVTAVVESLLRGEVVGLYQGRSEWGPRALGNRSILADPRRPEMKDIVNTKIKFREPFRPFAPVVLEEAAQDYFVIGCPEQEFLPRFMLTVAPVHEDKQSVIPATTHIGGTGRLQTIRRAYNPRYYDIVATFGQATGVPVVLNTSFNLRGEPMVNTPADAFKTFSNSGLDLLVLGSFLVRKPR
ncbi:MAG: carbamoyltransferase [Anaerolineae bacterium]|nr:carbamoyltransferase [Caldilineales bacterium]MDW8268835.1 carbamoyltransferase [Anaerolineae bacterium]